MRKPERTPGRYKKWRLKAPEYEKKGESSPACHVCAPFCSGHQRWEDAFAVRTNVCSKYNTALVNIQEIQSLILSHPQDRIEKGGQTYGRCKKTYRISRARPRSRFPLYGKVSRAGAGSDWVGANDWEGTVTMEIQGSEVLINKLLKGLNGGHFISIEWMDTKEIPLEEEQKFTVKM